MLKINELCEILALPRLKLKSNQAFTFDSMQEMMSTGSPKNENRLLSTQKRYNQEAELQKYYEVEMKKKEPKKVSYSDKKNLLRQNRSKDGLKQGESNSMIKTISYNFNQNSDYINVFQPENVNLKKEIYNLILN